LKPKQIRRLVRDVGRIPAERNTTYKILRTFENEPGEGDLDNVDDSSRFGSYFDLIKIKKFRFSQD
jgi:FO synthase subunit 2